MTESFAYRVDSDDRIVFISAEWERFALENLASELGGDSVIGQSLWDFVDGHQVKHLYGLVFDRVRQTGHQVVVPFRCDSPTERRFMELQVLLGDGNDLDLEGRLIRSEERAHVSVFDPAAPRSDEIVLICSWCKKLKSSNQEWVEVEVALEQLDLFCKSQLPQLSHGVCNPCRAELLESVHEAG